MLPPVSDRLQPFRFISLPADDQRCVGALIGEWSQNKSELAWIEKLRAASAQHNEPAFWRFKLAGVIGLLTIGLAIAAHTCCTSACSSRLYLTSLTRNGLDQHSPMPPISYAHTCLHPGPRCHKNSCARIGF
jgi:hypothetical protein